MKYNSLALLSLALTIVGCGANGEPDTAPTGSRTSLAPGGQIVFEPGSPKLAQIQVATVESAEIPQDLIVAPGKVEVNQNRVSTVVLPMPGRIVSVSAQLGDSVTQNQPLVTLESPEAYGILASWRQSEALLGQAEAALAKAEADVARLEALYEHRAAALKDLLNARHEVVQSEAAVRLARSAREEARHRIEILGLKKEEADQQVVVRAAVSGKILAINVVPGEYRNDTSSPLMTIADLSVVNVTSNVPESSIRFINVGESIEIRLAAYPDEVFRARVTGIADLVDPETRTIKVRAELANSRGRLRPEMFCEIRHSHGFRSLPVVPADAVIQKGGGASVYVERRPGAFELVSIETGPRLDGHVPVMSGLSPGDRVVVDGAILLPR